MKNVLIVSGHTDLNDSVANDLVLRRLKTQFPQAEYTVLSELYPDFNIDVEAEQQKLRRAEVPELDPICAGALAGGPLVWTRRPEHWSFLHVRLGDGTAPSRNTVAESTKRDAAIPSYVDRLDETVEQFRDVADVPTLETLAEQGIAYAYGPVIAPREPHLAWFEGVVMRGQVVPD